MQDWSSLDHHTGKTPRKEEGLQGRGRSGLLSVVSPEPLGVAFGNAEKMQSPAHPHPQGKGGGHLGQHWRAYLERPLGVPGQLKAAVILEALGVCVCKGQPAYW